MSAAPESYVLFSRDSLTRWLRAGTATAVVDFLFANALSVFAYGSTMARVWQGVSSTLLGPGAIGGGMQPVVIGVLMHIGVAFGWAAVLLVLFVSFPRLRAVMTSPYGVLKVAALWGPFIWMVMSLVVVPALVHRPPSITVRWWIQILGHVVFVAMPMVAMIDRSNVRGPRV